MEPSVLVVAGHDPHDGVTAGAGLDADREALRAFGRAARCVVTAWTDQRDGAVRALGARDPRAWLAEARAQLREAPARAPGSAPRTAPAIAAVKSGLLPGAAHVRALARLVDELPPGVPVVVDPVLAASDGTTFLDAEGSAALVAELLPRGVVLTPNVLEAARLAGELGGESIESGHLARDPDARLEVARRLLAAGARAVVLKGGHGVEDPVRDLVCEADAPPVWHAHPRVPGPGLHGSGCRFASALAAGLAAGLPTPEAARRAGEWVALRIAGNR